ncbi:MAG: potassium-transporting ATPase subunit KdpC [Dehalococcoidia bacterium]|nr:potassium-transporting ATPase subunit KdpC [Dehalococcoidia bacterium]
MAEQRLLSIRRLLLNAIILLGVMVLLTGIIYPLFITIVAQAVFPGQANGSLIEDEGKYLGSELIGQQFDREGYFWGRPSATEPSPYNGSASTGSNYGPTNAGLLVDVRKRIEALKKSDPENVRPIPVDLVTYSASGLDPHISQAAALYQVPRVARERHMSEEKIQEMVNRFTEGRQFGFLGEPRVNVLKLNIALDQTK